jgi:hypothetical protein
MLGIQLSLLSLFFVDIFVEYQGMLLSAHFRTFRSSQILHSECICVNAWNTRTLGHNYCETWNPNQATDSAIFSLITLTGTGVNK